MLTMILIVLAVVVVLAIVIARQPNEFRVTRSATMAAPAAVIFPHVNDLRKWLPWSPWAKLDPSARNDFQGPASGKGAVMHWDGNSKVGAGTTTITESKPNEFIQFRLEFLKPMKATNTAEFSFKPEGDKTVVTWTMYGKANFISKAMGLIMNCEEMVGAQFSKGLASLKFLVETNMGGQQ